MISYADAMQASLSLIALATMFWLGPNQSALMGSGVHRVPINDLVDHFDHYAKVRVVIAAASAVSLLLFLVLDASLLSLVAFGIGYAALTVRDMIVLYRISKRIARERGPQDDV